MKLKTFSSSHSTGFSCADAFGCKAAGFSCRGSAFLSSAGAHAGSSSSHRINKRATIALMTALITPRRYLELMDTQDGKHVTGRFQDGNHPRPTALPFQHFGFFFSGAL